MLSLTATGITAAAVGSSPGGGSAATMIFYGQGIASWASWTAATCAENRGYSANGRTTSSAPPTAPLALFLATQVLTAPTVANVSRY